LLPNVNTEHNEKDPSTIIAKGLFHEKALTLTRPPTAKTSIATDSDNDTLNIESQPRT